MFRRLAPLRIKLPTMVALLLAVCTGAVVVVAYRAVRSSVSAAAEGQLQSVVGRLADALATQRRRSATDGQRIGGIPRIHAWLTGGSDEAAARAALDSVERATPLTPAIVLTRRDGRKLIAGSAQLAPPQDLASGYGPFFLAADTVRYISAAPLMNASDTIGTLAIVRSAAGPTSASASLGGLAGQDVEILLANADGSVWTDLHQPMASPIATRELANTLAHGTFASDSTIAAVARIAGSPWIVWVSQPMSVAVEPATTLVRRLALIAIIGVLLGGLVAWLWIRRVIAPLDDAAATSEAIARGDYRRRITAPVAEDEVGRLAASFNSMAAEVERHSTELETLVTERTAALEQALADLRQAQDDVVRNARLATLGQLAGGVGHELRNPLGVMTNAVFVLETVVQNQDPMVRDYFGILKTQIALSEKIVADLLDFARTKPAARMPTSVSELVRHQVARLGPLGTTSVTEDFPASLPPADIDSVQIGQVVFNLVANAAQAIGDRGGVITCRARHDGNGSIALDIADDGPGMSEDVAKRIFEPLFTTKARGLGLGLAVSRMLAENNGGRLTFTTAKGEGTTFTLTMPTVAHG